jgi:5'-phosphate synthase pdxT subunit
VAAAPPISLAIGILALQGDFREHGAMMAALGHEPREVRRPHQLDGLAGLIVPGGESTTIARLLASNDLLEPVRALCARGTAVWGTCAGAILLAKQVDRLDRPGIEAMDISVRRNAFGRQVDSFEADVAIAGLAGGPFHAVFIRAPVIESVYGLAEAIGRLDDGTIVAARQGNLLASSFHPELTADTRMHQLFAEMAAGGSRD